MWDLETLRFLNEQAYLSTQKMVNSRLGVQEDDNSAKQPDVLPVFPLSLLAYKLIAGPASIVRLVDLVEGYESAIEFIELVREYLPRREGEILSLMDDSKRIERFCHYFNEAYFPLSEITYAYDDMTLGDFLNHIPVDLMGFSMEDEEDFINNRNGFILLLSITESEERVPLLDCVKEIVGKDLMEMIPHDGWDLGHLHEMLDGTEYEGCLAFADWVCQNTGCMQLDTNYNEYGPSDWSRWLVDALTEEYPRVVELQNKMYDMYEWLEKDPYRNFRELLMAILGEEDESAVPKEQMPFPLDKDGQVDRKEVIVHGR